MKSMESGTCVSLDQFLEAFFPDENEKIRFRALKAKDAPASKDNRAEKIGITRARLAKDANLHQWLRNLNRTRGLYFIPNAGGDTDNAITRFSSFFAEMDDRPIKDQQTAFDLAPIQPSARVKTRKSVHGYFFLKGNCTKEDWNDIQQCLIAHFRSDPKIKNPSRCMRLPGFDHVQYNKDDATYSYKSVEVAEFDPSRRYTVEDMRAAFPDAPSSDNLQTSAVTKQTQFPTWDNLNAELKRRIMSHPTAKINNDGWWHCKGVCHNGKNNSAIMFNPATGAVKCMNGCNHAEVLIAFGLPDHPNGNKAATVPKDEPKSLVVRRLADVKPEKVEWLWPPYIARRKLTICEGDPGEGKSWISCALATGVSCGRGLPGTEPREPENVLMLSAEDGLGDTIRPRLDSMGADVSRIYALDEPIIFDDSGLLQFEAAIIEYTPALVIVDPLFAFTGAKADIHRANEMRAITARLAAIADKHKCSIIAVRHLIKASKDKPLYAGIGSIDLTAAARSVLLVGHDPDDPNKRGIVQTKSNLAPFGDAIGYKIEGSNFYWTGKSDLTAEKILSVARDEDERNALLEAQEFLQQALANYPRPCGEIQKEARSVGIYDATLRRARIALRISARRVSEGNKGKGYWLWQLPQDAGLPPSNKDEHLAKQDFKPSESASWQDDQDLPF
jgi:AAA domain